MDRKQTLFSLVLQSFFVSLITGKAIVFDLGNVLVKPSKFRASHYIGWRRFGGYIFRDHKNPAHISDKVFDVLHQLGEQESLESGIFATYRQKKLPGIMCSWFAGQISGTEIIAQAKQKIQELSKENYFVSSREQEIIERIITLMFDPNLLVRYTKVKKRGLRLVKKLARKNHQLYILSNWDKLSFDILYTAPHMQKLFKYFKRDNIIISAEAGALKPYRTIYEKFKKYIAEQDQQKLTKRDELFFIDDQEDNIKTAVDFMIGFYLENDNYKALKRQFKDYGLI